jgi:hypothetical protein
MSRWQIVALLGIAILIIGLFVPIVDVPLGKLNYFSVFRTAHGAKFLLALMVASAVLVFFRLFKILRMTGGLAFALIIGHMIFMGRWVRAEDAKTNAGFHSVLRETSPWPEHYYRLQWGWAILIIGAVLIIVASLMKDESTTTTS